MLEDLSRKDKKLKALMAKVEGGFTLTIKEAHSPFEAISEAIIYQQLTGKAAATILGRFKDLFKNTPFPTPKQIVEAPDTVLRSAGLSGAKVAALKDLAAKTLAGHVPTIEDVDKMSDEEIVKCLTAVRGVGTWTAHMFLMFRLGRTDVMPSGDYGVRKGFAITYGDGVTLPSPQQLEEYAECWRPYRSIGSWYMWRAIEVNRLNTVPEHKTVVKKKPTKQLTKKPAASSPTKPETKRAVAKKTKPVTKKSTKPATTKPVAKKTTKQVTSKPVTKKPTKPTPTKPVAKTPTKPTTKKPVAKKTPKPATTKPVTKKPTKLEAKKLVSKKTSSKSKSTSKKVADKPARKRVRS